MSEYLSTDPNFGLDDGYLSTDPNFGLEKPKKRSIASDVYEVGRQVGAGAVVDLPKMAGQSIQAFTPKGSTISEYGKEMAKNAEARAPGWEPDLAGRGGIAAAFIRGGRSVAPSVASLPAYAAGPVVGGLATTALFGGSQYTEEHDKMKAAGASDEDARNAGLITGGIQGGGEAIANRLTLGLFGAGKKVAAEGIKGLVGQTVDKSVIKPFAKATGAALIGEPATEIAQDIGTAAVERQYGLPTQGYGNIAYDSGTTALAMTALLAPFGLAGHYKNSKRAEAIDKTLSDPEVGKMQRVGVVNGLYSEAKKLNIPDADAWHTGAMEDIANGLPVRRTPESQPAEQAANQERMQRDLDIQRGMGEVNAGNDILPVEDVTLNPVDEPAMYDVGYGEDLNAQALPSEIARQQFINNLEPPSYLEWAQSVDIADMIDSMPMKTSGQALTIQGILNGPFSTPVKEQAAARLWSLGQEARIPTPESLPANAGPLAKAAAAGQITGAVQLNNWGMAVTASVVGEPMQAGEKSNFVNTLKGLKNAQSQRAVAQPLQESNQGGRDNQAGSGITVSGRVGQPGKPAAEAPGGREQPILPMGNATVADVPGVTFEQELIETRNPPEVAQPISVSTTRFVTKTLSGEKNITAKLYELPGYVGPQLAVAKYKSPRGQGYRVYLPKSGTMLADNNGVGELEDTLRMAVQRVSNAKAKVSQNKTTPATPLPASAPAPVTQQVDMAHGDMSSRKASSEAKRLTQETGIDHVAVNSETPSDQIAAKSITRNGDNIVVIGYPREALENARTKLHANAIIDKKGQAVFRAGTDYTALQEALNPGSAYIPDAKSLKAADFPMYVSGGKFSNARAHNFAKKFGAKSFDNKPEAEAYAEALTRGEGGNWKAKKHLGKWRAVKEGVQDAQDQTKAQVPQTQAEQSQGVHGNKKQSTVMGEGKAQVVPAVPASDREKSYDKVEEKTKIQDNAPDEVRKGHAGVSTSDVAVHAQKAPDSAESENDRDHFTLERLNRDTNKLEKVTFERGEYVTYKTSSNGQSLYGDIDGISHSRREFSVDGLWHPFGFAYKAERPTPVEKPTVALSSVIDSVNKKYGSDLDYKDRIHTLDVHEDLFKRVTAGTVTADEFKASFDALLKNKDAIVTALSAMTKDAIFKRFPILSFRYKSDKKAEVVDAAFRDMASDFVLGQGFSYGMGRDSFIDGIRAVVKRTTDQDLVDHAAALSKARAERAVRRDQAASGMADPQTLEDFGRLMNAKAQEMGDGTTYQQVRMTLTPEQRARFDELAGEKTRAERKARADQQKTTVSAPSEAVGASEIIKTKHTKHGHDLWQFTLERRVPPDEFKTLVAQAKRMGGDYSSYRGNGAIPGWQFRSEDAAIAFRKLVAGDTTAAQEVMQARRDAFQDDKSQSAVERLNEMAERLEDQAAEALGRDRKANTARRARFAASAEAAANSDKALAKTMRNIAQAIADGKAKFLDRVRQKAQVEMLRGFVRTAKDDEIRQKYPAYSDYEKHRGEKPTGETADYAKFPTYTAFRSDLASLGRQLEQVDGSKKLGAALLKVADDVTSAYLKFAKENLHKVSTFTRAESAPAVFASKETAEEAIKRSGFKGKAIALPFKRGQNIIIMSPSAAKEAGIWQGDEDKRITINAEAGAEIVDKVKAMGRMNRISMPWSFESTYDARKRLAGIGIETPAEFRAALREFIALQEQPAAPDKIKEMERAMIGRRKDGLDFFPTPQSVAQDMIDAAELEEGMAVLEPSAGMGHIADQIRAAGVEPDVVEMSGERRELLDAKGYNLIGSDFMDMSPRGFTYGDVFRHKDGREGIMRGSGGMGSGRVGFIPEGDTDRKREWVDRDDLTGVRKTGANSGYDRIIMNPPFSDRRDIEHVRHAYELLKPRGRLVAIMGEGSFFGSDKKATEFRDWLDSLNGTSEKLDEGAFMDPTLPVNTGANARLVVVDKPADSKLSRSATTRSTIHPEDFAAVVQNARAAFPGMQFNALEDEQQAPASLRSFIEDQDASGDVAGAFHDGEVYLFANGIHDLTHAEHTVIHEATHGGLSRMFGDSVGPLMLDIKRSNLKVAAKAFELQKKYGYSVSRATEEVLADMGPEVTKLRNWDALVAFVRDQLRKVGLVKEWSDKDVEALILRALKAAKKPQSHVYRRSALNAMLSIGDSDAIVSGVGRDLVTLYHGTSVENADEIRSSGRINSGSYFGGINGVALTPRKSVAEDFSNGGEVIQVRIPISRLIVDPESYDGREIYEALADGASVYADGDIYIGNPDIRFSRSGQSTGRTQADPIWSAEPISKMDTFLYELQDKHIDTKRIIQAIQKQGKKIADDWNVYIKEALYHGRTAKKIEDFLTDEVKPALELMAKHGISQEDMDEYLHARHAIERNRVMKERNPDREDNDGLSGMTDEDAKAILAKAKPGFKEAAKVIDSIIAKTRQELVGYGLEKQETVDSWAELYSNYVPLQREGFEDRPGTGMGFSVRGNSSKEATGSHRAVENILAHVAMQREKAIVRGEKNRVATALYGLAQQFPNSAFWKLDKPAQMTQINPDTGQVEVVAGDLADYKVPRVKYIGKDGTVKERIDPNYKGRNNVMTVRINGVDHAIIFNDQDARAMRMVEALKNIDADQLGEIVGGIGHVTRYIASMATQYNPVFGVINLIRDTQTAALNLSSTELKGKQGQVMKASMVALKGIYQDARAVRDGKHPSSPYAKLWEEFQATGGQTGYRDMFRTSNDRAEAIEKMLDPEWWQKGKFGKAITLNGILAKPEQLLFDKVGRKAFNWLSDYNLAMENAMRLGAYKVARDNGMSKDKSAFLAKNLTVNFNKKGKAATQAGALYAFFNASAQGTARIAETLHAGAKDGEFLGKTGKAIVYGGITLGAMSAIALIMAGFDDDEPPEFMRERNLIIPAPGTDKGYVSIPMPLGFHVLPNIGRVLVESAVYGKPMDRMTDLLMTMLESFNPIGTGASLAQTISPTVFDPVIAMAENKDWTGKNIYREDFNKTNPTPGFTRTKDSASALSKGIAEAINTITGGTEFQPGRFSPTPDQIDYLIGQVTGGVGREITKVMASADSAVTGEELPMYKVPIAGRLVGTSSDNAAVRDRFYDNVRMLNMHEAEIKGRREKQEPTLDYIREHPETRYIRMATATETQVRNLQKRKRQMIEDGKRESVKLIDAQIAAKMKRLNDMVSNAKT